MLSLQQETPSGKPAKATAHLLPCRIHHDGPVEPAESFWDPNAGENDTTTAYFRGRKLHGKTVALPEGYRGVAAVTSSAEEQQSRRPEDDVDVDVIDVDVQMPQGTLHVQAEFDDLVVWGHDATADAAADPYVRGVEEWLQLAEQVCPAPC